MYRGVEQLVARRAHNPEVVGSSPSPAIENKDTRKVSFIFLRDQKKKNHANPKDMLIDEKTR